LATPRAPEPSAAAFCRECRCIQPHEMSFHPDIPIPPCLGELPCLAAHARSATSCLRLMTSLSRSCPQLTPLRPRPPSIRRTFFCLGEHSHPACVAFDGSIQAALRPCGRPRTTRLCCVSQQGLRCNAG